MSRKHKNGNHLAPKADSGVNGAETQEKAAQRIREQIALRHSKTAVELAKDLHKRANTKETETLLFDAYQCRIEDLLRTGMTVEAKALLEMVGERFPWSRSRTASLQREIAAADGRLDEFLAPLQDATLTEEVREHIETFVRQRIYDLPALAAVSCLPPEHPLRTGAAALAAAFEAVTRGPVDDQVVALPEVSRRSPLAPWKALIRAIASFYRREDDACRKWLQAVPEDSAAARLVRPLLAMMGTKTASDFNGAEQRLIAAVGDGSAALRPALVELEKVFAAKNDKKQLDAARATMALCGQLCPAILERLRQHIVVRALERGISSHRLSTAIGKPRENAYFWRLLARSFEQGSSPYVMAEAVSQWELFRSEAIREKWFSAGSLEDGVLSLHMARIAERVPSDTFDELEYERIPREDRSIGGFGDEELRSPAKLFERACQADPHPAAFQTWLDWANKQESGKAIDRVAELWRKALPGDTKPLLCLMESAEKRGAFQKALRYLEEAEELDRLNPDVRRAKLRLLLAATIRNLKQRKPRLARAEIERIEALPEVRDGEIAALATALRYLAATLDKDTTTIQAEHEKLYALMGGAVPAFVLLNGLAYSAAMECKNGLPLQNVSDYPPADLLSGVARACALGDWAGLPLKLPSGWEKPLLAVADRPDSSVDIRQLLLLGEAALRSGSPKLAYAVSAAGLVKGGADARFLLLRGRALPPSRRQQQQGCFMAALELARRERNLPLTGEVLDQLHGNYNRFGRLGFLDDSASASRPLDADLLNEILEEERATKKFPGPGYNRPPRYGAELEDDTCDCPVCRASRQESKWGDDEDMDDFDEDDESLSTSQMLDEMEEMMDSLPDHVVQKMDDAIARGVPPEVVMAKLLDNLLPETERSRPEKKKKKRTGKLPPPEQSSLF